MGKARLVQELATLIYPVASCVQKPVGLSLPPSDLLSCHGLSSSPSCQDCSSTRTKASLLQASQERICHCSDSTNRKLPPEIGEVGGYLPLRLHLSSAPALELGLHLGHCLQQLVQVLTALPKGPNYQLEKGWEAEQFPLHRPLLSLRCSGLFGCTNRLRRCDAQIDASNKN